MLWSFSILGMLQKPCNLRNIMNQLVAWMSKVGLTCYKKTNQV
jgi:hypothetical protein